MLTTILIYVGVGFLGVVAFFLAAFALFCWLSPGKEVPYLIDGMYPPD